MARAEKAVVADFDQSFGQDVLQEAAHELLSGKGAGPRLASVVGFVAKGDPILVDLEDTVVAEGDPEQIASQIVEGR